MTRQRFSILRVIMVISATFAFLTVFACGFCGYMFFAHGNQMDPESLRMTKLMTAFEGSMSAVFVTASVFLYFKLHPRKQSQRGFDVIK